MPGLRWHYAHGKLSEALGSMASNSGTLSKRLTNAYLSYLFMLEPRDFPSELGDRFKKLRDTVSTRPARWEGEGSVEATLSEMHPKQIKTLIEEIASLEYLLAQVYYDES